MLCMGRLLCSAVVSHHTLPWACCKGSSLWLQAESEQALEGCALLCVNELLVSASSAARLQGEDVAVQ